MSYKLSEAGISEIDRARRRKGWKKMDRNWVKEALSSESTLKRFLSGVPISAEHFTSLCRAVGLEDWQRLVDWEDHDSTRVPKIASESNLPKTTPKPTDTDVHSKATRYRLAVSAIFDPADLEEIEITIDHLLKLIARGTVTITNQDGKEVKEIKHPKLSD